MTASTDRGTNLRELAITQLRRKRGMQAHILAYVAVNLFLNAIWLVTTPGGFYWPVFPLVGWGIGLVFNIWDVYSGPPTEEQIERETHRLAHR
jgi:hypothetical protein